MNSVGLAWQQAPPLVQRAPLRIGAVDDPLEKEAEAVAERVMRMPSPEAALIQRCPGGCADEEVIRRQVDEDEEELLTQRPPEDGEQEILQRAPEKSQNSSLSAGVSSRIGSMIAAIRVPGSCSGDVRFEVQDGFGITKNPARAILHPAPARRGQSGANVAIIRTGDIVVEASVKATVPGKSPLSPAAKDTLQEWQVGFTQTMYQDFILARYEKSRVFHSLLKEAGGPVIDTKNHLVPFYPPGGISAKLISLNPLITGDAPEAPVDLLNPHAHRVCDPPDLLRSFFRQLDATMFVIAFNRSSNKVCPLAHMEWRQLTDVEVTDIKVEPLDAGFNIVSVTFSPPTVDGVRVGRAGRGQGPRSPETTAKGGNVANDFQDDFFFEDEGC